LLSAVALVMAMSGCRAMDVTEPIDLNGLQRGALWLAILLVPLVGAAIIVTLARGAPTSLLVRIGAYVYAAAACAVLLGLLIGIGAAIRVGGLACNGVPDPNRPSTVLQLGCTPGFDDSGLLVAIGVLLAVPLSISLAIAARALRHGEGVVALGILAAAVAGGAIVGMREVGSGDGALRLSIAILVVAASAAIPLLAEVAFGAPADQNESGSPSSGSASSSAAITSQRSLQSAQR
jgi:hypothetical protein